MGLDGSSPQRLTDTGPWNSTPAWSPNGTKIVFSSARDGNSEIYVMSADGTNPERLTNSQWTDDFPAWSPDGTKIVFRSFRRQNEIHLVDYAPDSQKSQTVYVTDGWLPRWSPDGSQIVYAKNRDIWTTTVDGRKQVNLTKNPLVEDRYPAWQPSRTPHRLKTKLLTRWATFKMKETEQRAQTRTPIQ
jgi:TolB protein